MKETRWNPSRRVFTHAKKKGKKKTPGGQKKKRKESLGDSPQVKKGDPQAGEGTVAHALPDGMEGGGGGGTGTHRTLVS